MCGCRLLSLAENSGKNYLWLEVSDPHALMAFAAGRMPSSFCSREISSPAQQLSALRGFPSSLASVLSNLKAQAPPWGPVPPHLWVELGSLQDREEDFTPEHLLYQPPAPVISHWREVLMAMGKVATCGCGAGKEGFPEEVLFGQSLGEWSGQGWEAGRITYLREQLGGLGSTLEEVVEFLEVEEVVVVVVVVEEEEEEEEEEEKEEKEEEEEKEEVKEEVAATVMALWERERKNTLRYDASLCASH